MSDSDDLPPLKWRTYDHDHEPISDEEFTRLYFASSHVMGSGGGEPHGKCCDCQQTAGWINELCGSDHVWCDACFKRRIAQMPEGGERGKPPPPFTADEARWRRDPVAQAVLDELIGTPELWDLVLSFDRGRMAWEDRGNHTWQFVLRQSCARVWRRVIGAALDVAARMKPPGVDLPAPDVVVEPGEGRP